MNDKFYINEKGIDGKSATCSLQEFLNNRGMIINFDNKEIYNYINYKFSNWDVEHIKNTYVDFDFSEYNIIDKKELKINDFILKFNSEKNIFVINDRKFLIEESFDLFSETIKVFKKKLKVYDGIKGLIKNILYLHFNQYKIDYFLAKIYDY